MYDLFSDFFDGFNIFSDAPVYNKEEAKCPLCGRTYRDFMNSGKLGCGTCYETFRTALAPTLRQIHQNPVHKGKIPSRGKDRLKKKRQYEQLKQQLSEAVKNEDYETAAKLHKEIRKMERSEN